MAEIVVRFDLKFSSRVVRLGLVAAALAAMAPELASESVNLTTYYPAPSGVYTQMTVTGYSYLARDLTGGQASAVVIGSNATPAAGSNIMLTVTDPTGDANTRVGIGTTNPAAGYMLDVQGGAVIGVADPFGGPSGASTGLLVQGHSPGAWPFGGSPGLYANGDNHSGGGIAVSDDGGFVDWNDGWVTYQGSTGIRVSGNGGIGSGVAGTTGMLWVEGNFGVTGGQPWNSKASIDVGGVVMSHQDCTVASYVTANPGFATSCGPGQYATNIAGFYAHYMAMGDAPAPNLATAGIGNSGVLTFADGTMLCCACPDGACSPANGFW